MKHLHPKNVEPVSARQRPPMGPPRAQPPKSHHHGPSGAAVGVGSTTHSGAENAGSEGEMELVDRSWETYFREQIHLELPSRNLRSCVYVAGPPLAPNCPNQTAVVLLHGGGHTSMSWALVASALGGCGWPVLAIDFRAHGVLVTVFHTSITLCSVFPLSTCARMCARSRVLCMPVFECVPKPKSPSCV